MSENKLREMMPPNLGPKAIPAAKEFKATKQTNRSHSSTNGGIMSERNPFKSLTDSGQPIRF